MIYWLSPVPEKCETCDAPIGEKFYDAATDSVTGPWACICPTCFTLGPGIGKLGLGLGQEYTRTQVGDKIRYVKTGG